MAKVDEVRLKFENKSLYSAATLVGNWFEEKSSYKKHDYKHNSTTSAVYTPKEATTNSPSDLWGSKLRNEGYDPRIIFDHEFPKYLENFSTTYDLTYNHFPKCMDGPRKREWRSRLKRYEPEQDYTANFGNVTNHNLRAVKQFDRYESRNDPRKTDVSVYKDDFPAHDHRDYDFKRYAIPIPNSSLMSGTNIELEKLQLRGACVMSMPPNAQLVEVPRPKYCNPITWECPPELNVVEKTVKCIRPQKRMINRQKRTDTGS